MGDKFVFVENPKTASTSCKNALLAAELGQSMFRKHNNQFHENIIPNKRHRAVVVRNPWDRMVSGFLHATRSNVAAQFREWVADPDPWFIGQGIDFKRTPQVFWAHRTNHVLRFENVQEDFYKFTAKLGQPLTLPHDNAAKTRLPYQDYYDDHTRELVADRFAPDIKQWGYSF